MPRVGWCHFRHTGRTHTESRSTHGWWRRAAGNEGWLAEGRKHWGEHQMHSPTPHQSFCSDVSAGICCWWPWNRQNRSYFTPELPQLLLSHPWIHLIPINNKVNSPHKGRYEQTNSYTVNKDHPQQQLQSLQDSHVQHQTKAYCWHCRGIEGTGKEGKKGVDMTRLDLDHMSTDVPHSQMLSRARKAGSSLAHWSLVCFL